MTVPMKKLRLWLVLGTSLTWLSTSHALTVISDIDDTVKISHVNDIGGAIAHAPLVQAFTGMSAVYQDLVSTGVVNQFYYVSGSPEFLNAHLHRFISVNNFPSGPIVLKRFGDPSDIEAYKLQKIRAILNQITDKVILIGDDTQKDAATYAELSLEFPGRVDSIYIHRVTGNPLPREASAAGAKLFTTAADLAVELYKKQRLSLQIVSDTAELLLNDPTDRMVSDFQACPSRETLLTVGDPSVDRLLNQVQSRVLELCNTDD